MIGRKKYPSRVEALELVKWASALNPGQWVQHCKTVAAVAERIAIACNMDSDKAYVCGLLHDIGRFEGVRALHHAVAGYSLMMEKGYDDIARICLTHSYPIKEVKSFSGKRDCTEEELGFIDSYLKTAEYDQFDKLIQLCDAISLPTGVVLMDIRLVDVALRHGFNEYTVDKWKAFYALKEYFDKLYNGNIYELFKDELVRGILDSCISREHIVKY